MIGRVVLVSLLALTACKKTEAPAGSDPTGADKADKAAGDKPTDNAGTDKPTGEKQNPRSPAATTTPSSSGDKRVEKQTGPGFTVNASGPATSEKVPTNDGDRAFERFTFHKTATELYVVEVTDLPESEDVGMVIKQMRMRLTSQTQAVLSDEMIEGEVTGFDLRYVIDQGDDTLRARSKLIPNGHKVFEVRAVSAEDAAREAEAQKFVDSFAVTP